MTQLAFPLDGGGPAVQVTSQVPARSTASLPGPRPPQDGEYRVCWCGPDGQEHWHTITPTPWDIASIPERQEER